jgi:hypothetical protein
MPTHRSDHPLVSEQELVDTVARMELRLSKHPSAGVQALFEKYRALVVRFEADLGASARDVALARASALMLVQEVARDESAG